jgi:hypothetical protein
MAKVRYNNEEYQALPWIIAKALARSRDSSNITAASLRLKRDGPYLAAGAGHETNRERQVFVDG